MLQIDHKTALGVKGHQLNRSFGSRRKRSNQWFSADYALREYKVYAKGVQALLMNQYALNLSP